MRHVMNKASTFLTNPERQWTLKGWPPSISLLTLNGMIALTLTAFYNQHFFTSLYHLYPFSITYNILFVVSAGLIITLMTFIILCIITPYYGAKTILTLILIGSSAASYFINHYGIVIDTGMIQNIIETDIHEASDTFNLNLLFDLFILGFIPSAIVWKVKIKPLKWRQSLIIRSAAIVFGLALIALTLMSFSNTYASFFRNYKEVRYSAVPLNYLYATGRYIYDHQQPSLVYQQLGTDAHLGPLAQAQTKPSLTILVVGETGRADHFGLNGYPRNTTPLLAQQHLINFDQVSSCGTSTAVSVPCMFSRQDRADYNEARTLAQDGLLQVLQHAGLSVLWRDNNSGCKGACQGVPYQDMSRQNDDLNCNQRECFDAVMLDQLDQILKTSAQNTLIVLHQHGSHGPDYYHRYPPEFEFYRPTCQTNQLQQCHQTELINTYDNTIRYTDYFLNQVIEWLKRQEGQYNTAMIYVADHGESLGENGIYLHGMPYMMAPKAQTHVPFFYWLSDSFAHAYHIDSACLAAKQHQAFSQDNLFDSILGMLNVRTHIYQPDHDMLASCQQSVQ